MPTFKVVFIDSGRLGATDFSIEQNELDRVDAELVLANCANDEEVVEVAQGADAILNGMYYMDAALLGQLRGVKVIVRSGVGVDNIEVPAATEAGILVCNVIDYGYNEVANHAMAMLLALNRKLLPLDRAARAGEGRPAAGALAHTGRLAGETLGLCAFGNIAREVARRAQGFGLHVIAHDPFVDPLVAESAGVDLVSLEDLLRRSDYLSIHTPLTEETRGLIGADQLALMKPSAYLVITSRGGVVDEAALHQALSEGRLAGAGIDVWVHEPVRTDDPLLSHDSVLASSHLAWYSDISPGVLRQRVAEAAADVLAGITPRSMINPAVGQRLGLAPRPG